MILPFRLMTDRDTGKLKGFGFCEFMDLATAESAKRNLNGRDYNGRQLRVDFAGEDGEGKTEGEKKPTAPSATVMNYDAPMGQAPASAAQAQMKNAGLGGGCMDAVTARLAEMSPAQLFSVMNQLKTLTTQNQTTARQLLVSNPQLTLALFQAQLALGMTKPPAVAAGSAPAPPQGIAGSAPLPPPPGGMMRPGMMGVPGMPKHGAMGVPGMPPHPGMSPQYGGPQFPPPPPRIGGVAPLPPPPMGGAAQLPGLPAAAPAGGVDQQQQLLQQVISMTPEQMALLPPDQRQQVEMLRQIAVQQGMM